MLEKHIHINSIGLVSFVKSRRSSRIRITVKPKGVSVSLPVQVPYSEAIRFVESKTDWILAQQSKHEACLTVFGPESNFRTKFHQLKITKGNYPKVFNRIGNGIIQFFVPDRFNHEMPEIQEFIKDVLIKLMRYEAKVYLPKRVDELAQIHGLRYKKVFIKNASTRWGSCSSENNINLNLHLMRLPNHLIDYVVLHELAHTVEKNHGPKFWALLGRLVGGDPKKLSREVKKYRTTNF